MRASWLVAVLALALAGCQEPSPPDRELRFDPDLEALRLQACSSHVVWLPAPRFGELGFNVSVDDDAIGDWSEPCSPDVPGEPRPYLVLELIAVQGPAGVHLSENPDAMRSLGIGQQAVYGGISLAAPEGPWGPAGVYELAYDALRGEGTLAWLTCIPVRDCYSTDTI